MQNLAATNMQLCYIEDLFYVVMCSIPNALIYCCSEMPNFIRLSAHSALDLHNQARSSCEIHRATYNSKMRINQQFDVIWTATNKILLLTLAMVTCKVIHHCVASLSEQCIADLMFCYGTQTMHKGRISHCLLFHERGNQNFM